jgi:predicted transcriptional regulator
MGINMDLALVQRDILAALINLHHQNRQAIKSEEIAELMDRNPGTIRNQMQSLRALNLVGAVQGRHGGYRATGEAYEALNLDNCGDELAVPVIRNRVLVKGATASEIIFNNIMHSNHCGAVIRIIGNIRDFDIGDEAEVGPTPANNLCIRGNVLGRDFTMSRLILEVTGMISVPNISVKKIARRAISISPKTSLQEAAKILVNNGVQEALVEDKYPGLISMADITRAVAEGRTGLEVCEIMARGFPTIDSEELIYEAIKMLGKMGASQLVVLEKGMLWGIVTSGDLIKPLVAS